MKKSTKYYQFTALLLIVAFILQTFNKTFIVVDYYSSYAYYLEQCENKSKPQVHCNGKCQMLKKMKVEEKKDQDNPERKSEFKNQITLSSKSFFCTVDRKAYLLNSIKYFFPLSSGKSIDRSFDILHPPQV